MAEGMAEQMEEGHTEEEHIVVEGQSIQRQREWRMRQVVLLKVRKIQTVKLQLVMPKVLGLFKVIKHELQALIQEVCFKEKSHYKKWLCCGN